jgi:hypothetical protein
MLPELSIKFVRSTKAAAAPRAVSEDIGRREKAMMDDG